MADYTVGLSSGCDSGAIPPDCEPFLSNRPHLLTVQFSPLLIESWLSGSRWPNLCDYWSQQNRKVVTFSAAINHSLLRWSVMESSAIGAKTILATRVFSFLLPAVTLHRLSSPAVSAGIFWVFGWSDRSAIYGSSALFQGSITSLRRVGWFNKYVRVKWRRGLAIITVIIIITTVNSQGLVGGCRKCCGQRIHVHV